MAARHPEHSLPAGYQRRKPTEAQKRLAAEMGNVWRYDPRFRAYAIFRHAPMSRAPVSAGFAGRPLMEYKVELTAYYTPARGQGRPFKVPQVVFREATDRSMAEQRAVEELEHDGWTRVKLVKSTLIGPVLHRKFPKRIHHIGTAAGAAKARAKKAAKASHRHVGAKRICRTVCRRKDGTFKSC